MTAVAVKTAISVPDITFHRVTRRAEELGISRSQLFSDAVVWYLDGLDAHALTHQINDALDRMPADDNLVAVGHSRRMLADLPDDW